MAAAVATGHARFDALWQEARGAYAAPLAHYNIAPNAFVLYFLLSESLIAALFAGAGLFIELKGPKTPMALFAASALMLYGVTIPPPMHALVVNAPVLPQWLLLERSLGFGLFIVFLYVFPDGRFTAWPVRILSALVIGWTLSWPFVGSANPYHFPHPWPFIAIASLFASAVIVQLYWFYRVRTPVERAQTKWVVYAVTASVVGDFVTHLPWQILHIAKGSDLVLLLVHQPFFVAFQIVVPLALAFSVMYYHLWEIDFVVSRTVLYALVTSMVAILWEAVNMTSTKLIEKAMGPQASTFAGGTATVVTGFFLKPMYEGLKGAVDKRLSPATLDLSSEFPEFEPDVRLRLTLAHVVEALVGHTSPLFDVADSAVYLFRDRTLTLLKARTEDGRDAPTMQLDDATLATLRQGKAARGSDAGNAPVYVPLVVPRATNPDLLGVLVLGPRANEKGYSQLELAALEDLGRKAGMAMYIEEAPAASLAAKAPLTSPVTEGSAGDNGRRLGEVPSVG